ncbi:MAG: tetratricopeptide repeat protein [Candidatus Eremiobacteraeota bacterium]|nr:tetratricopeptide repeat protein [Candidatus Eremiobacteraeota bacterium]
MDSKVMKIHKILRVLSGSFTPMELSIQHDYGAETMAWKSLTHLFGVRFKKGETVPSLLFFVKGKDPLYCIEANSFNYRAFLKDDFSTRREANFLSLVKFFNYHADEAYVDWPLRDCMKGGLNLLPLFSDQKKLTEYCYSSREKVLEKKPEKAEAPREDSLIAVFRRKLDIFATRRKEAMKFFSRGQALLAKMRKSEEEQELKGDEHLSVMLKAADEFERSLQVDPFTLHSCIALGEIYQDLEEYEKALENFLSAVEMNPDFDGQKEVAYLVYSMGIASIYRAMGNKEGERWALSEYLGYFPRGKDAAAIAEFFSQCDSVKSDWYQFYSHGIDLIHKKQYQQALDILGTSISIYPVFRWCHHWKAQALIELGKVKEAFDSFIIANKYYYNVFTDMDLAKLFQGQGKHEQAQEYLRRVVQIVPRFALPHMQLGRFLYHVDRDETESFESLMKAVEINPNGDFVAEAEQIVSQISEAQKERREKVITSRKEWHKGDIIEKNYEVLESHKGGMGIVYIVKDLSSGQVYALKSFQEQFLWNERILKMFIKEAEIWVKLGSHRNIVQARTFKNLDGKPYIFLEYIDGTDLEHMLYEGVFDVQMAMEYALQFCEGMNYASKKLGIVHQDIKPSNCLITNEGVLKITDFGLVKVFSEDAGEKIERIRSKKNDDDPISSGGAVGTFPYMSPEQFSRATGVSTSSDIYSFGAMFFEMLLGTPPFGDESIEECIHGHLNKAPADPCRVRNDIPHEVCEIILRCLKKHPHERFGDFEELILALNVAYENIFGISYSFSGAAGETTIDELIHRGESLMTLMRYKEALEIFDEGLELEPEMAKLIVAKAECLYRVGQTEEAMKYFDIAVAKEPENADIWHNRGNLYASMKNYREALYCYDKALAIDSERAEVWSMKGVLYDLQGYRKEALRCYDRALKSNPRLSEAWNNKGNLLNKMDKIQEAIECYTKAIEINPRYLMAWFNKGVLLQKINSHKDAIESFVRVTEIDSTFVNAWVGCGVSSFKLNDIEKALEYYDMAIELQPGNPQFWIFKGNCLYEMGRLESATSCIDRALRLNQADIRAWISKGVIMGELHYFDHAIKSYEKALELNPHNDFVIKALERLKSKESRVQQFLLVAAGSPVIARFQDEELEVCEGDCENILHHHDSLLEMYPDDPIVKYRKALVLLLTGRDSEALELFEHIQAYCSEKPIPNLKEERVKYAQVQHEKTSRKGGILERLTGKEKFTHTQWFSEGMKFYQSGDHVQAVKSFENCLRTHPEVIDAWKFAALSLIELGYSDEALDTVAKGIARAPLSPELWAVKGAIHERSHRISDAIEAYDIALLIFPGYFEGWLKAILCLEGVTHYSLAKEYAVKALRYAEARHDRKGPRDPLLYQTISKFSSVLERYEISKKYQDVVFSGGQDDYHLWILRGDAHFRLGEFPEAVKFLRRVIESYPENKGALLRLALCYRETGEYDDALATLQRLIEQAPSFEYGLFYMAIMLGELNEKEEGNRFLNEAIEKAPHLPLLWEARGIFLFLQGKEKEALWCFDKSLELNHWDVTIWLNKGIVLNKACKPSDAVYCFDRILKIDRENFRSLFFKSLSLLMMKEWTAAIECCNKVLEINPRVVDPWIFKSVALYRTDKFQEALHSLDRALEIDPERAEIWNNRGVLQRKMEKLEDAIKCYNKAIDIDYKCVLAWYNKGCWLSEINRLEEAIECYDSALEAEARHALSWREKGHCHFELKRYQEALRCYEMCLKLDPASAECWNSKGLTVFQGGRLEESLFCFEKSIERDGQNADVLNNRGVVLGLLNRRKEALEVFSRVFAIDDEHQGALYNRILILAKQNFSEEAENEYRRLREIHPDFVRPLPGLESNDFIISSLKRSSASHILIEYKLDYKLYIRKPPHFFLV